MRPSVGWITVAVFDVVQAPFDLADRAVVGDLRARQGLRDAAGAAGNISGVGIPAGFSDPKFFQGRPILVAEP